MKDGYRGSLDFKKSLECASRSDWHTLRDSAAGKFSGSVFLSSWACLASGRQQVQLSQCLLWQHLLFPADILHHYRASTQIVPGSHLGFILLPSRSVWGNNGTCFMPPASLRLEQQNKTPTLLLRYSRSLSSAITDLVWAENSCRLRENRILCWWTCLSLLLHTRVHKWAQRLLWLHQVISDGLRRAAPLLQMHKVIFNSFL